MNPASLADHYEGSPAPPAALGGETGLPRLLQEAFLGKSKSAVSTAPLPAEGTKGVASSLAGDDEPAEEQALRLRTGEDAINFFAQFGADSPIKFVHLVCPDRGVRNYRPYDLEVVSNPTDCGPEYFTMSNSGLVHVQPGCPSEFIPLGDWMRQSTLFNILRSIPFYRNYLPAKAFAAWRDSVRYKLFCRQRRKVMSKLFVARASFAGPLVELRRAMLEMESLKLLDVGPVKTFERAQFTAHQSSRRHDSAKALEACMERVGTIVQKVCGTVVGMARAIEGGDGSAGEGSSAITFEPVVKSKSLVAAKELAALRRQQHVRAVQEARMLGDFIILVDYMAVESLAALVLHSLQGFLAELMRPRKAGLFETTVQFTDDGTSFAPGCAEILESIQSATEAMIHTVSGVGRLRYLRSLSEHLSRSGRGEGEGPDIRAIIRDSSDFVTTVADVEEKLTDDFEEAADYVVTLESIRPIHEYDCNWDFDVYRAQQHSVSSLRTEMERVSGWINELEKMRARQPCGCLEVESRKLKQTLLPATEEKLESLKGLVRDLARVKCRDQLGQYKAHISSVSSRPAQLKDFAAYVESLEQLKSQEKALSRNTHVVEQMYVLMASYEVKAPSEDMVSRISSHWHDAVPQTPCVHTNFVYVRANAGPTR